MIEIVCKIFVYIMLCAGDIHAHIFAGERAHGKARCFAREHSGRVHAEERRKLEQEADGNVHTAALVSAVFRLAHAGCRGSLRNRVVRNFTQRFEPGSNLHHLIGHGITSKIFT